MELSTLIPSQLTDTQSLYPFSGSHSLYTLRSVPYTCTKGAKVQAQARYKYSVSVKYSGKADDVKVIGVHWGKGTTNQYASSATASKTSYSKTLELYDGIHYKIEGYVKLKTGQTITSKTTSVTPWFVIV